MTTIATDGVSISCDSRVIGDFIEQMDSPKIFRVGQQIIGICGSYSEGLRYVAWLQDGQRDSDRPKLSEFEALHISKSGVYWVGKDLHPVKSAKISAIGSGGRYAMAAMLAGADTRKAVQIASKLDPSTGGAIKTMKLRK